MTMIYNLFFLAAGLLLIINSMYAFATDRGLMRIPNLFSSISGKSKIKYAFYEHFLAGIFYVTYGLIVYKANITNLLLNIVIAILLYLGASTISYVKNII
ncbi:MAG: hypothetical protein K0R80_3129 [Clostridia bacterium]|jgi:hypothetical protein|nr:hypothetical protein [Clostridia bacterium]